MKITKRADQCPLVMLWTAPPPPHRVPRMWGLLKLPQFREELPMQTVTAIGFDIARSVCSRSMALMPLARWSFVVN